jgi:hypothetical protein
MSKESVQGQTQEEECSNAAMLGWGWAGLVLGELAGLAD